MVITRFHKIKCDDNNLYSIGTLMYIQIVGQWPTNGNVRDGDVPMSDQTE